MQPEAHTHYSGTYFDKDSVLRVERSARVAAWAVLVGYGLDSGYTVYQTVNSAVIGNYPIDYSFALTVMVRVFQGVALFVLLRLAGKIALIMMDIEDNTRRLARK